MPSALHLVPLDTTTKHHHHDFHQIVIGVDGNAEFEIEGLGGSIAPLSGCIVPANHVHYYEGVGVNRHLILNLPSTSYPLADQHHAFARLFDAPHFFSLDTALTRYLEFLVQELGRQEHEMPQPLAHHELMVATFLSCLNVRQPSARETRSGQQRINLASLDHYIQRHLSQRLGVADLARHACLSEAHFNDCFRQQTGITPYQYLLTKRLRAAQHLLLSTRIPLSQIADQTGFSSQSSLSHAFRRSFGHPPSALRRQA
ncbi:helix-turn-helix domain-containing protein [Onishia niordana]|uniref:helix-turn-helix domain-containing protein n=1 Tax=Onishia niordana TaxID=2508711 RepID=UPI00109F496E|nr:helix-turn-helix domain-containing protein [Halomonas niordiana]